MDERVWEKTAQFLKELRCEDTGRLSQLQLPEYQKAMKEKFSYQPIYEQTVCEMTGLPKNDENPSSFCELPCTWAMKNPYTRSCLLIHG